MSEVPPVAPSPRRTTLTAALVIAGATALFSVLVTVGIIDRFRAAPAAAPQAVAAQPVAMPATKVIVAPAAATDPATLSAREEILGAQLAALEQRAAAITGEAANAYGNATRAEALLIAFAARRAIDRGLGLGYLEQQLRARFGVAQPGEVAIVVNAAAHPVGLEDLRLGLDQIGPQLALGPAGGGGWGAAFFRMLGSLIVIHPKNTPSPVPGERLERAKRFLALGQVEAAIAEVERLPGAAQATGWMTGAQQYVAARRALDTLEGAAIAGRAAIPAAPVPVPAPAPAPAR